MNIILKNIYKSFDHVQVLADFSLTIPSGKLTTLLGASGCGKTTLLRCIAGLETPETGDILFEERIVFSSEKRIHIPPERRHLGFVFQDFALWPHMNVFENTAFGLRASGETADIEKKVMEALDSVRLTEYAHRYPHQLSGGQQQRVAFARAIAIDPDCILFDEPLSALDANLRAQMRSELQELVRQRNLTAVFVTHDQGEALSISDNIVVMNEGTIMQSGTPEEIYNSPADTFTASFVGSGNWLSDTQMIRPENISLTPVDHSISERMSVVSCQFMGDRYMLSLSRHGEDASSPQWLVPSHIRIQPGNTIQVHIPRSHIITF